MSGQFSTLLINAQESTNPSGVCCRGGSSRQDSDSLTWSSDFYPKRRPPPIVAFPSSIVSLIVIKGKEASLPILARRYAQWVGERVAFARSQSREREDNGGKVSQHVRHAVAKSNRFGANPPGRLGKTTTNIRSLCTSSPRSARMVHMQKRLGSCRRSLAA